METNKINYYAIGLYGSMILTQLVTSDYMKILWFMVTILNGLGLIYTFYTLRKR